MPYPETCIELDGKKIKSITVEGEGWVDFLDGDEGFWAYEPGDTNKSWVVVKRNGKEVDRYNMRYVMRIRWKEGKMEDDLPF